MGCDCREAIAGGSELTMWESSKMVGGSQSNETDEKPQRTA